ncbi:hypothetical protein PVAND_014487 [Polypedilum vanderplanki]|uniref:Lipocalin n=1 Tax=Polypedilum vanderplanki TaxID=319348 RepID=A0A9J6B9J1_POLVA|nr:hypothetical protein PVAND_014487 [Polypedilum vanderplanki]
MKILIFVVWILFKNSFTQVPIEGKCNEFKNCTEPYLKINADAFDGIYFLYAFVPTFKVEYNQKCTYFEFNKTTHGTRNFYKFEIDSETNEERITSAEFRVGLNGTIEAKYTELQIELKYKIVALTKDVIVLLSCYECGFLSKEGAGISALGLSRYSSPNCEISTIILRKFRECGIFESYVEYQDQENCNDCVLY